MQVTSDIWLQIGLHLRPRYLCKLMRTSKRIKNIVDNETYWTRVAAHMVWRDCDCIEINTMREPQYIFPRIEHNLYYMLGLERGYYWSMERFFKQMDEVIDYFKENDSTEYRDWWASIKSMSLADKTREWIKEEYNSYLKRMSESDLTMSMKEVSKKKFLESFAQQENDKKYNKFLCEMEDDPMPIIYKQKIFRKLDGFLWSLYSMDDLYCPTDIAFGICKF